MDLQGFVNSLPPHTFRSLVSAIMARFETDALKVGVLTNAERVLAECGERIKVIKCVRERTGMSLMECKNAVDAEVPQP